MARETAPLKMSADGKEDDLAGSDAAMHVRCRVRGKQMRVPCGDGSQPVRWLAVVVAQRFALMQPNGRRRGREESGAARGFYIPDNVTLHGSLCAPNERIADVLKDGDEVTVQLRDSELKDGAPVISDWSAEAFCHDEATLRRLADKKAREAAESKPNSDAEAKTMGSGGSLGPASARAEAKGVGSRERGRGIRYEEKYANMEEFLADAKH